MPVAVTIEQLSELAPASLAGYRSAFACGAEVLAYYAISDSGLRVAHFIAQVLHETAALTLTHENLRYSGKRLVEIWPRRFKPRGPLDPADYADQPEKLGNAVYGGRMGNVEPGDGYLYRGRGLLQLTGKDSYERATTLLQQAWPAAPDLVRAPEQAASAQWCLQVAAAQWHARGCNRAADCDDVAGVTYLINGGAVGLAERIMWTAKTRSAWKVARD